VEAWLVKREVGVEEEGPGVERREGGVVGGLEVDILVFGVGERVVEHEIDLGFDLDEGLQG